MKAGNDSLTEQDREHLKEAVFVKSSIHLHVDYLKTLLATANQEKTRNVYEGFAWVKVPGVTSYTCLFTNLTNKH